MIQPSKEQDLAFLDSCKKSLCGYLSEVTAENTLYLNKIPRAIRIGITAYIPKSKDVLNAYYTYAAAVGNIFASKIDPAAAAIASLLIRLDGEGESELLSECDRVLGEYEGYRRIFSEFIEASERSVLTRNDNVKLSDVVSALQLFQFRTDETAKKWNTEA